jgi:hypothetical protein
MVTAHFRFHGALNDFLPRHRQHSEISCVCARAATAKHMIEALGIPHTEVTILLINGKPCGFDRMLLDGDKLCAYTTDCTAVDENLVLELLGRPRFIADAHLGGLARMLRMAGFDTLYENSFEDGQIAALSSEQERIVLTRDRELLKRRMVKCGAYVRAIKAPLQFSEIAERYNLHAHARPFTLCLRCNTPLRSVALEAVQVSVPAAVRATHTAFQICDGCGGVFWKGSHWRRMCDALAAAGMSELMTHRADGAD